MRTILRAILVRQLPIQNLLWCVAGVTSLLRPLRSDPRRNGPTHQRHVRRLSQQARSALRVWRQVRMKMRLITMVRLEALLVILSSRPACYH